VPLTQAIDFSGQTIAGVHVVRRYGEPGSRKWLCVCACGEKFPAAYRTLWANDIAGTSAGCPRCVSARLSAKARARAGRNAA
jgi:hypothetical protein